MSELNDNEICPYEDKSIKPCSVKDCKSYQFKKQCSETTSKLSHNIKEYLAEVQECGLFNFYRTKLCTHSKNLGSIVGFNKDDYILDILRDFLLGARRYDLDFEIHDTLKFDHIIKTNSPVYYTAGTQKHLKIDTQRLSTPVNVIICKERSQSGLHLEDLKLDEIMSSLREKIAQPYFSYTEDESTSNFDESGQLRLTNWHPDYHIELHEHKDAKKSSKTTYDREIHVCTTMFKKSSQLTFTKDERNGDLAWTNDITIAADTALSPREWGEVMANITKLIRNNNGSIEKFRERIARLHLPSECFKEYPVRNMNISQQSFYFQCLQINNRFFNTMGPNEQFAYREIIHDYCQVLGTKL